MAIGDSWTTQINPRSLGDYRGLGQAGGRFVAVSSDGSTDDQVIYSDNAEDWFTATHPASTVSNIWEAVAGDGAGLWVAIASNSSVADRHYMQSTDNAQTWQFGGVEVDAEFLAIIHDGSQFVACGAKSSRQIGRSADGETWVYSNTADPLTNWHGIAFDGTTYVMVGVGGKIARSVDLLSWSIVTVSGSPAFKGIVKVSVGVFIAVASNGADRIHRSTDSGASWSPVDGAVGSWASVVTDGDQAVIVGGASSTMRRSEDGGLTWGNISNTISGQSALAYHSGLLVAVSETAAAASSLSTSGTFICTILGDPARYISLGEDTTGSRLLTDDEYRLFIKARIAKNQSKGTINSIVDMIAFVVGSTDFAVVDGIDPAEFTVTFDSGALTGNDIIFITQSDLIPKPAGVTLNVVENP